jgi:hypothetical protein
MDYPETFGSLRKPAAEVSGRFPEFSINRKKILIKNFLNNFGMSDDDMIC